MPITNKGRLARARSFYQAIGEVTNRTMDPDSDLHDITYQNYYIGLAYSEEEESPEELLSPQVFQRIPLQKDGIINYKFCSMVRDLTPLIDEWKDRVFFYEGERWVYHTELEILTGKVTTGGALVDLFEIAPEPFYIFVDVEINREKVLEKLGDLTEYKFNQVSLCSYLAVKDNKIDKEVLLPGDLRDPSVNEIKYHVESFYPINTRTLADGSEVKLQFMLQF